MPDYEKCKELIVESLKEMIQAYTEEDCCPIRFKFPKYRQSKEKRVSEQEARFAFIAHLIQESDYKFSVEKPTDNRYQFSKTTLPKIFVEGEPGGESALFDLCLYDSGPVEGNGVPIEFKAKNVNKKYIAKDFLKLAAEAPEYGFFVWVLKNTDEGTPKSIGEKLKCIKSYLCKDPISSKLDKVRNGKNNPKICIFVCVLEKGEIYHCDDFFQLNQPNDFLNPGDWLRDL